MELKVEDFIKFRNLIYDKAGIFFETKKIYFVKKRIEKRVVALELKDAGEYFRVLKVMDKMGKELQNLLNLLTTNETYFFRETNQVDVFVNHCLPEIMELKKHKLKKTIKIWSAGCSTGEEPYSLAIKLMEAYKWNDFSFKIMATDIDTVVLDKAKEAIYSERSLRNLSPALIKKYFLPASEGTRLRSNVKKMVDFQHLNLFNNLLMRKNREFDFIFCRNVLIYFDDASRRSVVANFYDSLSPGGYIFLGHAESVTRISTSFKVRRAGGQIVHQKPL